LPIFIALITGILHAMTLDLYNTKAATSISLPFISSGVMAGFPSPADDYLDISMDLNKELIKNPPSTFFARVKGLSMKDEGIMPNNILVVDKSIQPKTGDLAVCFIDGDFTLKRIKKQKDCLYLMPSNKDFEPIKVTENNDFVVWGIVTYIIKKP
jgi:DNA polymerase V